MRPLTGIIILLFVTAGPVRAQQESYSGPDPKIAFLKSLAVPGWGHYHVSNTRWNRGRYHLAAEAGLLLGYVGLSIYSHNIEQNWYTYGQAQAGVPLKGRSREFQLAVGNFNSLQAYNDYQLRSRNWDRLFEDKAENRWQWSGKEERLKYNDLRSRFERIDNQLPALIGMMVVNRIISGISAYNRAQKQRQAASASTVYLSPYHYNGGITANLLIRF